MKYLSIVLGFILFLYTGHCQFQGYFSDFEESIANIVEANVKHYATCRTPIQSDDGTCMHSLECYAKGGVPFSGGGCPFTKSCCVFERGCLNETRHFRERITYFTSTGRNALPGASCLFTIDPINENIRQIRLDFINFRLENSNNTCITEYFETVPVLNNIPPLCGDNTGQHLYIHLQSASSMTFKIKTATNTSASWKIKITQLEYPNRRNFWYKHKIDFRDIDLIAPIGCRQYYTEPEGVIESFGYASTIFIADQYYAICFKKDIGHSTLRVFPEYAQWPQATNIACQNRSMYLYFPPEITFTGNTQQTVGDICFLPNSEATTISPGPFVIVVKSMGINQPVATGNTRPFYGFRMRYSF